MKVKPNPAFTIAHVLKFLPWLVVLSLLLLVVWLLRLGSEAPSEAATVITATPQQSTYTPMSEKQSSVTPTSRQDTSVEVTVATQVTEGAVNSAPNSHSPVGNDTFSFKDRAHSLIEWVTGLVSDTPSTNSSNTSSTPQSSTVISTIPKQVVIEPAVEAPVADGEVDPVPVVSHLPVAYGEVKNQDRVHAGDDSMYLKDEDK